MTYKQIVSISGAQDDMVYITPQAIDFLERFKAAAEKPSPYWTTRLNNALRETGMAFVDSGWANGIQQAEKLHEIPAIHQNTTITENGSVRHLPSPLYGNEAQYVSFDEGKVDVAKVSEFAKAFARVSGQKCDQDFETAVLGAVMAANATLVDGNWAYHAQSFLENSARAGEVDALLAQRLG